MIRDPGEVKSVIKACGVLKAFKYEGEVLSLAEIVERTWLKKTTAFRLLQSLVRGGLLERVGKGSYRCQIQLLSHPAVRLGFAVQTDSEFCREVTESLRRAASREHVHLIIVNNKYSAKEALRNADSLIREHVDLVLEFQTYERVAPTIAAKFLEANIPVIAIEIPHPGATYFGANNYQAGLIGGRALGQWAKNNWEGKADQVLLLELPIAGSLPQLRVSGMMAGLKEVLPAIDQKPVFHLDGKGGFEDNLEEVRRYLRRTKPNRTLVCAINDMCALAALRAFEEAGAIHLCAVMGQNAIREARDELRRPRTKLVGSVAYFPERYGDQIVPLALDILQKKPVSSAVFVKHQLITPKNVDLVYPLDARDGKPKSAQELRVEAAK
jgi:ribose transport system substrate-binding protein